MAKNKKDSPAKTALIVLLTLVGGLAATALLMWGVDRFAAAGLIAHTAVVRDGGASLLVVLDSRGRNRRGNSLPPTLRSQVFNLATGSRVARNVLGSYRLAGADGNLAWVWDSSTGLSARDLLTGTTVVSGEQTRALVPGAQAVGVHEAFWNYGNVRFVLEDGREMFASASQLRALAPSQRSDESIPWSVWSSQRVYFMERGARSELWVNNQRVQGPSFLQPSFVGGRTLNAGKLVPELDAMLVRHRERFNGPFVVSAVTPDGRILWNFPLERAGSLRYFMQLYAVTYAQGAIVLTAEYSGPSTTLIVLDARTGALRWTAGL